LPYQTRKKKKQYKTKMKDNFNGKNTPSPILLPKHDQAVVRSVSSINTMTPSAAASIPNHKIQSNSIPFIKNDSNYSFIDKILGTISCIDGPDYQQSSSTLIIPGLYLFDSPKDKAIRLHSSLNNKTENLQKCLESIPTKELEQLKSVSRIVFHKPVKPIDFNDVKCVGKSSPKLALGENEVKKVDKDNVDAQRESEAACKPKVNLSKLNELIDPLVHSHMDGLKKSSNVDVTSQVSLPAKDESIEKDLEKIVQIVKPKLIELKMGKPEASKIVNKNDEENNFLLRPVDRALNQGISKLNAELESRLKQMQQRQNKATLYLNQSQESKQQQYVQYPTLSQSFDTKNCVNDDHSRVIPKNEKRHSLQVTMQPRESDIEGVQRATKVNVPQSQRYSGSFQNNNEILSKIMQTNALVAKYGGQPILSNIACQKECNKKPPIRIAHDQKNKSITLTYDSNKEHASNGEQPTAKWTKSGEVIQVLNLSDGSVKCKKIYPNQNTSPFSSSSPPMPNVSRHSSLKENGSNKNDLLMADALRKQILQQKIEQIKVRIEKLNLSSSLNQNFTAISNTNDTKQRTNNSMQRSSTPLTKSNTVPMVVCAEHTFPNRNKTNYCISPRLSAESLENASNSLKFYIREKTKMYHVDAANELKVKQNFIALNELRKRDDLAAVGTSEATPTNVSSAFRKFDSKLQQQNSAPIKTNLSQEQKKEINVNNLEKTSSSSQIKSILKKSTSKSNVEPVVKEYVDVDKLSRTYSLMDKLITKSTKTTHASTQR
jgi:hypothetical protein